MDDWLLRRQLHHELGHQQLCRYRRRARELKHQGWKKTAIAAALGVTPGAVSQWLKRGRTQGVDALRRHPAAGPTPRLTPEQRAQIPALLAPRRSRLGVRGRGLDLQAGGRGDPAHLWGVVPSRPCVQTAAAPGAQFPAASGSCHPAQRRRDCRLVAGPLARSQKKATDEGRTIVWVNQSGFYLLPMAVRTWAPRRHTPILRVPLTHEHLAAIGALTPDGRLFLQVQDHTYRSPDVVRFLQVLLRKIAGKLLLIWDGAPIHRSQPVKDFLAGGAAKRLHLEQLPPYAPDLNPVEGLWNYLRRVELGNVCWSTAEPRCASGAATGERAPAPQASASCSRVY